MDAGTSWIRRSLKEGASITVNSANAEPDEKSFRECGYAVVRGVLSATDVAELRELCRNLLDVPGAQELLPTSFVHTEQLAEVLVRPAVVAAFRDVLGGRYSLYPNMTVRKNLYVGWHVDEAFLGAGRQYIWSDAFRHVQGAIYLQDNDDDNGGGGLDVVPGSHRVSLDSYGTTTPELPRAFDTVLRDHGAHRVRSRAGDLVLWDARLLHASTPSSGTRDKFGVFVSAGRDDLYENNRFLSHLVAKRIQMVDGAPVLYPRHAAVLDMRFPASYPDSLTERLKDADVAVATF